MTFLPPEYNVPDSPSAYMKFKQGANRFRILGPAVTGYEYWNIENKPIRQRKQFDLIPEDIKLKDDGTYSDIKHFWAFPVWNYQDNMVQILEITQASIQRGLKIKIDNRDGNASNNDFIVTRTGTGFDTEYDVDVADPSPIPTDAVVALKAKPINLEALFDGGDPFKLSANPQPQNPSKGFEKFEDAADSLPGQKNPTTGQNEPQVADDIAEEAARIEAGEGLPFE
jgi:hypothetical protein